MGGGLTLGAEIPNFEVDSTQGPMKFHDYLGNGWGILFSHPADYTPVCTTELGTVAKLVATGEFAKRDCKVAALSVDDIESHKGWVKDIEASQSTTVAYPIIADPNRELAVKFGILDADEKDKAGVAVTARAVYIIGPDKKLKLSILYPATTGRNFNEILRVLDSLQLTANHKVATPANWQHGDKCMVVPSLTDEEATARFPKGFEKVAVPSGKSYIRLTPQPNVD